MAGAAGLWLVLATDGGNREWVLAALLRWGPLAVVGLRLVLELLLFVGLGAVPLWPLVPLSALRLGLVPGSSLGAGWAPLPPGARFAAGIGWTRNGTRVGADSGFGLPPSSFTFVPFDHFTDRHLPDHRLDTRQANTIFSATTVNNNFVVGPDQRIINRGVDPRRIEAATGTSLRQVAARELSARERAFRAGAGLSFGATRPQGRGEFPASRPGVAPWGRRLEERAGPSAVVPAWRREPSRPSEPPTAPRIGPWAPVQPPQPARPAEPANNAPRPQPAPANSGNAPSRQPAQR